MQPGEVTLLLWSAAYFFFLLSSYFLLRPVREAMGIERGYETLPWLMTGTMIAMALINPVFALLVSRVPRHRFIPLTLHFFAANMLLFFALFVTTSESARVSLGYAFYIWLSVFNLFVVSVFWAFMADLFTTEQSKRLFGFIAAGGTIGALCGPAATQWLVSGVSVPGVGSITLKPHYLLLVSLSLLELAALCAAQLTRNISCSSSDAPLTVSPGASAMTADKSADVAACPRRCIRHRSGSEPGPGILRGLVLIARSPYLLLICLFMLLFTTLSTFLYMEQGRIVEQTFVDQAARTVAFARLDMFTQGLTLVMQCFITGRLIRLIGLGSAMMIVPILTAVGFAALLAAPTFMTLAIFVVLRRGLHYAIDKPAREVLYTVVGPDAKYKSKSFIDTFVYRSGDLIGGWTPLLLARLSIAVGYAAIPLALLATVVAAGLGHLHNALARIRDELQPADLLPAFRPPAGSAAQSVAGVAASASDTTVQH